MLVRVNQFSGLIPRSDPHLLPPSAATVAENCKMVSGNLKPWNLPTVVNTPSKTGTKLSIYLYEHLYWLTWTTDVDVVKGTLPNDAYNRLYWSGDGTPKMSTQSLILTGGTDYPNASFDLGIPAPIHAPIVALGPDWTENTMPYVGSWHVTFGNGLFVAVMTNSNAAATSPDGVTWTPQTLPTNAYWDCITYGNGLFVTLATGSTIAATSPDGITWTQRVMPTNTDWSSVTYGNGLFLAIALGTLYAATSVDGITWTPQTLPTSISSAGGLTFGSGQFVIGPYFGSTALTSPDGVTWTPRTLPNTHADSQTLGFGNGTYVLLDGDGNTALTSADGIIWTTRILPVSQVWSSIAFGSNTFIAVGGNSNITIASIDLGVTWSIRKTVSYAWGSVTFGSSMFVAVGVSNKVDILSNIDQTTQETRSYVYRYVSTFGEVGPPSPASLPIDVWPEQIVNLSGIDTAPAGNYSIATIQIYRTATGSTATAYQYVDTITIGTTIYSDSIAVTALGEVLDSLLWDGPPVDLAGLISLPNGSLCGFSGSEVCFSVPYQPHAWPVNQRYPLPDVIVGVKSFGSSVLATTKTKPQIIIVGNDLTTLQPQEAENGYACVSKRGMVDMSGAIAYPEPVGLSLVGVNGVQLISYQEFDKDSWQALHPSTISAYYYGGQYVAFTDLGCFIFEVGTSAYNNVGNLTLTNQNFSHITDLVATAGYHDPATGNLYLAVGADIVQWDSGSPMTVVWVSKPFTVNAPKNMSAARVYANSYPVFFHLYADGNLKSTTMVANDKPFRLPGGYRAKEFNVGIEGTAIVYEVFMADSMAALREV